MRSELQNPRQLVRMAHWWSMWLCLPWLLMVTACGPSSDGAVAPAQRTSASQGNTPACPRSDSAPAGLYPVTAWKAAPSDALITHPISGLSVRHALAPHWGGDWVRLRLSNRYSTAPVTLENLHIAKEKSPGLPDMVAGTECLLTFNGQPRVTLQAGQTVLSDWVQYPLRAFERVGVSFYAPEATPQLTRHLNANELVYVSMPGDHAAEAAGGAYQATPDGYASNFLVIEALETAASKSVSTLVAVGDSITDGSDSTTGFKDGQPSPMTSTDQRYPDHLQRRLLTAGLPLTVANAGIGGNELLKDGWLPQFGKALLDRFDADVLQTAGVTHVLLMIGTNDFGNPKAGLPPTSEALIAGYKELIARAHRAGLNIVLGTIPPAEGAVTEGLLVPLRVMHGTEQARRGRDEVNAWIRQQTLSDGVVDFATCLEDPKRPGYLAPQYNSGDNLHPTPAGYAAMAQCVDLRLFQTMD
ncbi:GDSL-type esterase/lipase family protein [Limnobacter humi]|uniref:GDSL-type esterase/lipase family protein n=1 Tax=Limnobacter humi TaxID=1778671 RepID=A0ABT1WBX1_9BURK|nr:GDSL-type esterase/lipase family protein [Limnobacter humi]MCQ8895009.1 GDSL-type esterase/lipase family protein [Limnobacter humi]